MAGLYVTFGKCDAARLDAVAERMRFGSEAEDRFQSDICYAWLSHDPPSRFAPAVDPVTGVRCIVGGRLAWPTNVWQKAERMPFEGGTASRVLLDRYLRSGAAGVAPYNGAATVLIWDPREQVVHLWTDQFGYHPAFVYGDDKKLPLAFTTFPEALAADPAFEVQPDLVSMAEFLRAWRVTPPHTYYKDLKHAGAASYHRYELKSGIASKEFYWRPFEGEFFKTLPEASEALAVALTAAIEERTAISERAVFFVSGGADSRVMLFAATDPAKVWGVNLYEHPTHESEIARALCDRAGANYVGFGRDSDYYPRLHAENIRWSGAMWSADDGHYLGVRDVVRGIGADLVMTACTTDWVFKGYGLEKDYRKLFGRNLPIKRFIDRRVDGFLPNYPLPPPAAHADEINARMENWFRGTPENLRSDLDRLLVEDRRIRPTCYTVSVSGQIMYRTYPYDTFLADSRVAECYSRMPARWKLNGDAWGLAGKKVCAGAADIIDVNFGWSMGAGTPTKLLQFGKGWVKRRVSMRSASPDSQGHPPSYASWPDMGWYALHSPTLRRLWTETGKDDRELISSLFFMDPWAVGLDYWAERPSELMRLVTIVEFLRAKRAPLRR